MIEPGERATRPALTRDYILRFALQIIDSDGLGALTMRRLGSDLGVDPMAIYRHVRNKGALLDGVTELVWSQALAPQSIDTSESWDTGLFTAMCRLREVLLDHPNVLSLVSTHPLVTTPQLTLIEQCLAALEAAGMPSGLNVLGLLNSVASYTTGSVIAEAAEPAGGAGGESNSEEFTRAVEGLPRVARLLEPLREHRHDQAERRSVQYQIGLRALISGWPGAQVDSSSAND